MDYFICDRSIENTKTDEKLPNNVDILTRTYRLKLNDIKEDDVIRKINLPDDILDHIMSFLYKADVSILIYTTPRETNFQTPIKILKRIDCKISRNINVELFKNFPVYKLRDVLHTKIYSKTCSGYKGEVDWDIKDIFQYLTPHDKWLLWQYNGLIAGGIEIQHGDAERL